MWGDPQRAFRLEPSDPLSALLCQVTGPAHIPWNDARWQELFLGYDVWVHLEHLPEGCHDMARHALTSSNLAALALHVSRFLSELKHASQKDAEDDDDETITAGDDFTRRIALVGKARATAGALRLMRILVHDVIIDCSAKEGGESASSSSLEEALLYQPRSSVVDHHHHHGRSSRHRRSSATTKNAGKELLFSILSFLSHMGDADSPSTLHLLTSVPELYDSTVLSLELLLVLLSSQLYQPMVSSTQLHEMQSQQDDGATRNDNIFLNQIMTEASSRQRQERKRQRQEQDAFRMGQQPPQQQLDGNGDNRGDRNSATSKSDEAKQQQQHKSHGYKDWSAQSILKACLTWLIQRPSAPVRSIAHHNAQLARAVVQAKEKKQVGPDGMYESHVIVMAAKPEVGSDRRSSLDHIVSHHNNPSSSHALATTNATTHLRPPSQLILDATKGVLVLSSTLILLPFRLMSLALGLWGFKHQNQLGYDQVRMTQLRSSFQQQNPQQPKLTNDVLWISDSSIADLGSTLFLLLTNNYRVKQTIPDSLSEDDNNDNLVTTSEDSNPFRTELASLNDVRWEGSDSFNSSNAAGEPDPLGHAALAILQDGGNGESSDTTEQPSNETMDAFLQQEGESAQDHFMLAKPSTTRLKHKSSRQLLTTNFEYLFEAFGNVLHTEVGALVLYTVLQSSPIFAASVAVRSDLDTLVMPLLRTLYFSSAITHYSQKDSPGNAAVVATVGSTTPRQQGSSTDSSSSAAAAAATCPFRSQSQLYVILILLLLFSQDASFGSDAFRRVTVPNVVWYKERHLKDINLGSVLMLVLLRCITFTTNRLHDAFLLSNCCAVLMNLSPNTVNVHEYAAMRLASVTMSAMKRYSILVAKNGGKVYVDEDISTSVGMYGEVSRTLLRLLRHAVGPKNIDKNVHLVYALVYHQSDFNNVVSKKNCPFTETEVGRIGIVISEAAKAIQEDGDARTAPKALNVLKKSMGRLKAAVSKPKRSESADSSISEMQDAASDFTFTYEEEADPEIFFIPYIWEVIVCVVTVSSLEWSKRHIQVFPLLEQTEDSIPEVNGNTAAATESVEAPKGYSEDVSDVV